MPERLPESVQKLYVRMRRHDAQLVENKVAPGQITAGIIALLENRNNRGTLKALQDLWDRHADEMDRHLEDHIGRLQTERPELHDHLMEMERREEFLQQVKEAAHVRAVAYSRKNNNYTAPLPKAIGAALVRMLKEKKKEAEAPASQPQNTAPRTSVTGHGLVKLRYHGLNAKDIYSALLKPQEYGIEDEHAKLLGEVFTPSGPPKTMRQLAKEHGMDYIELNRLIDNVMRRIQVVTGQKT